jgi:Eukaryotic-type carbonic anhydrase
MHIVSYDEENYGSVREAMVQPKGLAVIGLLFQVIFTVCILTEHKCFDVVWWD